MRAVHVRLGEIYNVKKIINKPKVSDFAYRRLAAVLKYITNMIHNKNGEKIISGISEVHEAEIWADKLTTDYANEVVGNYKKAKTPNIEEKRLSAKFYKQSPKHKFWKNSLNVFYKIESLSKGMNLFKWKENGEEYGCYTVGIIVQPDWVKISEKEYDDAIPRLPASLYQVFLKESVNELLKAEKSIVKNGYVKITINEEYKCSDADLAKYKIEYKYPLHLIHLGIDLHKAELKLSDDLKRKWFID